MFHFIPTDGEMDGFFFTDSIPYMGLIDRKGVHLYNTNKPFTAVYNKADGHQLSFATPNLDPTTHQVLSTFRIRGSVQQDKSGNIYVATPQGLGFRQCPQ